MIYNPTAGPWNAERVMKYVCRYLEHRGWSVELRVTEKQGDATRMAAETAQAGYDTAIAAGGDGTVNEAINGLVGTDTALGVLPVGTGNLWARQMGIPTNPLTSPLRLIEATSALLRSTPRSIDLGQVNDRHFLCWAGIGLDAQVTSELEPRDRHTKRLGVLPYALATVLVARDFQGVRTRVFLDGAVVRGRSLLVLVSNIQQYAAYFNIAQEARLDDGLLDVFIFKGFGLRYVVRHIVRIASNRHLQNPQVVHRQAREVRVIADQETPVQVDGDPAGMTPVSITVVPRALRVLVPPSAPPSLFSESV